MIMSSSMDSSSGGSQHPQLPPGYRFHPTDEELVVHYLKKKIASAPLPVAIIAEVDLYRFDPWELPAKASFGEHEWYFFSPRDRKYPNGARPNRAATSGYWKATGTDKPILTAGGTQKIAVKKALVFYRGKPPKGIKTNWIMHEYRLIDNNNNNNNGVMQPPGVKKNSTRLDDWVLCRIYKKNNSQRPPMEFEKQAPVPMDGSPSTVGHRRHNLEIRMQVETKQASNCGLFLDNNNNDPFFEGLLSDNPEAATTTSVTLQSDPNYWNEATGGDSSTSTTKNVCVLANNSTSVANLANSGFHHQVLLGSLGDGVYSQHYQVSGINWSS